MQHVPPHTDQDFVGVVSKLFAASDRHATNAPLCALATDGLPSFPLPGLLPGLPPAPAGQNGPGRPAATHRPAAPKLTRREHDVLRLVATGRADPEIAAALGIALPTVATHIKTARAKLQAKTRAQAVAHYLLICLL